MLTVVDPGSGVPPGIVHAIQRAAGVEVEASDDPGVIEGADALILPWSGPPSEAMAAMEERDLIEPLQDLARQRVPILGVGAGALLLAGALADGTPGLGLLPGEIVPVPVSVASGGQRTFTGWTPLQPVADADPLLDGVVPGAWFYYVTAWVLSPGDADAASVVATSACNGNRFPAVVHANQAYAVLFEAAKSGDAGLRVLANFARYVQSLSQVAGQ